MPPIPGPRYPDPRPRTPIPDPQTPDPRMLPSQTQRMIMLCGIVLGVPAWWWAAGLLSPADGLSGWAVFDAGPGALAAVGWLVLAALPALAVAGVVAATGNPISGVLTAAISGMIALGPVRFDGVARRAADAGRTAGLYPRLALELVIWFVLASAAMFLIQWLSRRWRPRLPRRLASRHLGGRVELVNIDRRGAAAGVVTALIGAVLSMVLVQSSDPGQVMGGLVLGFGVAALVGHAVSPNQRPWATLLAPGMVGLVGYAWAGWRVSSAGGGDFLLGSLYAGDFPGVGLGVVLPVHWVMAGVAGAVVGVGVGQVLEKAKLG